MHTHKVLPGICTEIHRPQSVGAANTGHFFLPNDTTASLARGVQRITKAVLYHLARPAKEGEKLSEQGGEVKAFGGKPKHAMAVRGSRRLTSSDIRIIRERRANGERVVDIALDYGICDSHVSLIARGVIWKKAGGPIGNDYATRGSSLTQRIGRYVIKGEDEEACWKWTGRLTPDGYAQITFNRHASPAHRLVLEQKLGRALGQDEVTRHTCHNRPCLNPRHLIPGTRQDNSNDMVHAGRSLFGERQPAHKLTESEVDEIRKAASRGKINYEEFGRRYGVTGKNISLIVNGERWKRRRPSTPSPRSTTLELAAPDTSGTNRSAPTPQSNPAYHPCEDCGREFCDECGWARGGR